jgi:hypothetical protein
MHVQPLCSAAILGKKGQSNRYMDVWNLPALAVILRASCICRILQAAECREYCPPGNVALSGEEDDLHVTAMTVCQPLSVSNHSDLIDCDKVRNLGAGN